jgi:hypothetical protein
MKRSSKIALVISVIYVGIATLILINTIIDVNEKSIFFIIEENSLDFFRPGYILGFSLGFFGGNLLAVLGQMLTFIMLFIFIKLILDFFIRSLNIFKHNEKR